MKSHDRRMHEQRFRWRKGGMEANHLRRIASIGNGKSWCEHYRLKTSRGKDKSSEQGEEGDGIETAVIYHWS